MHNRQIFEKKKKKENKNQEDYLDRKPSEAEFKLIGKPLSLQRSHASN